MDNRKAEKVKAFFCTKCDQNFNSKIEKEAHKRKVHQKVLECPICHKLLANRASLHNHKGVHSKSMDQCCEYCGARFRLRTALLNHIRNQHVKVGNYACSRCNFMCNKLIAFNKHMLGHSESHQCSQCSRCFVTAYKLQRHYKTHTKRNNQEHVCHQCDKTFKRKDSCQEHEMRHSGKQSETCTVCSKSFWTKLQLSRHMRIHNDVKPYSCSKCGRAMRDSSNLRRHKEICKAEENNSSRESGLSTPNPAESKKDDACWQLIGSKSEESVVLAIDDEPQQGNEIVGFKPASILQYVEHKGDLTYILVYDKEEVALPQTWVMQ